MRYEDYIGNVARLAVELANTGTVVSAEEPLLHQHLVSQPSAEELVPLLALLGPAVAAVADGTSLDPVNRLLRRYPPRLHISTHDGLPHLHHAEDGEPPIPWLGRTCAAALAHVACGVPEVIIGRCQACPTFFVDQSRNHSRRFCSNKCASRTTVAAYRERRKGTR